MSNRHHKYRNGRFEIYFDETSDVSGKTRKPIFCAEMPDEESTGNAFWQIKFTCDFDNFETDWQTVLIYDLALKHHIYNIA